MPHRSVGTIIKNQSIIVATADMSVSVAAASMCEAHVGAILVAGADGKLVGIFTERDALNRVLAKGKDARQTTLGDVMTADPKTVTADLPFRTALYLMHEHNFRHVPVVDAAGKPLGVVSVRDALGPEMEEFKEDQTQREHLQEILG